jgi:hypothetical protein
MQTHEAPRRNEHEDGAMLNRGARTWPLPAPTATTRCGWPARPTASLECLQLLRAATRGAA